MSITNKQLVNYCVQAVGCPYWYGCFGQTSTKGLYQQKKRQYPKYYKWSCPSSQLGKKVFDCIGLIKGAIWSNGVFSNNPKYNPSQDVSANGMYSKCVKKGVISSIPETPGVLVFSEGHVGVYIGNGYVIEARGHDYGVVKTELKKRAWTHWGFCPWISYEKTSNSTNVKYFKKYTGKSNSIVDALKAIGAQSSFAYRTKIAKANGIKMYIGSPSQNIQMLVLLEKGTLIKP